MKNDKKTKTTGRTRELLARLKTLAPGDDFNGLSREDIIFWLETYENGVAP